MSFQSSVSHGGIQRAVLLEKKFIECLFIHAVYISTSVHSDHKVVFVGALRVACYWELQVLPSLNFPLLASI